MLKTSVLPVVVNGRTLTHTLTQSYYVTRLVEAVKTIPPMEAYEFVATKAFTDLSNVLDEAGSEKREEQLLPGTYIKMEIVLVGSINLTAVWCTSKKASMLLLFVSRKKTVSGIISVTPYCFFLLLLLTSMKFPQFIIIFKSPQASWSSATRTLSTATAPTRSACPLPPGSPAQTRRSRTWRSSGQSSTRSTQWRRSTTRR